MLLWVKPGQRLWAEPACSSPSRYLQGPPLEEWPQPWQSAGTGRHLPRHPRVGVQPGAPPAPLGSVQAPSPSLLEHRGTSGCVCVCVRVPAKHFRVPQTRHPRWGLHLGMVLDQGFIRPACLVKTSRKEPAAGTSERHGSQRVCALVCVILVTTQSRVPQDLSRSLLWECTGVAGDNLCDLFWFFFPIFWELQVLMGPNP